MSEPHICLFGGSSPVCVRLTHWACAKNNMYFHIRHACENNVLSFSYACSNDRTRRRKREAIERRRESERLRARERRAQEGTEQRTYRLERNGQ